MTQTIFPALHYRDGDAALDWIKRAFGARERAVYRRDDGAILHGELLIEGGLVMLGQYDGAWRGGHTPDALASTVSLYIAVSDPDAHHRRAVDAGATVVRELEDMDYGSREYSVRDLEGNLWSFGTYRPEPDGS